SGQRVGAHAVDRYHAADVVALFRRRIIEHLHEVAYLVEKRLGSNHDQRVGALVHADRHLVGLFRAALILLLATAAAPQGLDKLLRRGLLLPLTPAGNHAVAVQLFHSGGDLFRIGREDGDHARLAGDFRIRTVLGVDV